MGKKKGKRIYKTMTAADRKKYAEMRKTIEREEKEEILAWARKPKPRLAHDLAARAENETICVQIRRIPGRAHVDIRNVIRWLKQVRQAEGLTLEQVGQRCGMAKQAIGRLEKQTDHPNVTIATLERYASALGKRLVLTLEEEEN